jgi:hypothetical protein
MKAIGLCRQPDICVAMLLPDESFQWSGSAHRSHAKGVLIPGNQAEAFAATQVMSQMADVILLRDEIQDRNAYELAGRDHLVLFPELWESG